MSNDIPDSEQILSVQVIDGIFSISVVVKLAEAVPPIFNEDIPINQICQILKTTHIVHLSVTCSQFLVKWPTSKDCLLQQAFSDFYLYNKSLTFHNIFNYCTYRTRPYFSKNRSMSFSRTSWGKFPVKQSFNI